MARHGQDLCCWCIPYRFATFLGGLVLGAFGGAGSYLYFTHTDLPSRDIAVGSTIIQPFASGEALWYYFAAVSVLAAAVGLFGMLSALAGNRRMVKTFEAFYVLSLLTQFALIAWSIIWIKLRQTDFDMVCNASKEGVFSIPLLPSFAEEWSCQKIFTAAVLTVGIGGLLWVAFNFYMTNRVIHYARLLYTEKQNRYKVLGAAASKELDREQQIPLNYTNVGGTRNDREVQSSQHPTSYQDEIEYKDPRSDGGYNNATAGGAGAFSQGVVFHQPPVAPGFQHRDSQQAFDLVNPYYADQSTPQQYEPAPAPITMANTPAHLLHTSSTNYHSQARSGSGSGSGSLGAGVGAGQSFTHASTNQIASPFGDDDEPVMVSPPAAHSDGIKVPVSPTPQDEFDIISPTSAVATPAFPNDKGVFSPGPPDSGSNSKF